MSGSPSGGLAWPLRGLDPYGEAEREAWGGRLAERDALARALAADDARALLLHGEPGAGKTSLLRAGLIPHLRDGGVVALACDDLGAPAAGLATALAGFGIQPAAREAPSAFLARAVANAVAGQRFVFVVDDADAICADEVAVAELAEAYGRVMARAGGRARFVFAAASERVHLLTALERRTGALFPPAQRLELGRLPVADAGKLLERLLAQAALPAAPGLAEAVAEGLRQGQPVLPVDLQVAALALRELGISTGQGLARAGGAAALEGAWLARACRAAGGERAALRLCGELAAQPAGGPLAEVAARASVEPGAARALLEALEQRGVVVRGDAEASTWALRHEALAPRVRELAAPARAAARRAAELLGPPRPGGLGLRELRALRAEGITPSTPAERAAVERARRRYATLAGAALAAPALALALAYGAMRGRVYYELAPGAGGERIQVRAGRAGLQAFAWLPARPAFGAVLADTGLTRAMVAPEAWKKVGRLELGGPRAGWDGELAGLMAPRLAGLIAYATGGGEATLAALRRSARDPEELAELLAALRPIARGGDAEVALVESALTTPSPAVQRAAVALAGAAARRLPAAYAPTLTQALIAADPELRRLAFAAVRGLGAERARALFAAALARDPASPTRRELLVEVSNAAADDAPSPASAAAVLGDPDASPALRDRARNQLRAALSQDAAAATAALTTLLALDRAPGDARVFAIELLRDLDPLPTGPALVDGVRAAVASRSEAVRAAALPLYARVDPARAAGDLATLLGDLKLSRPLRVATALGWGELVRADRAAAVAALDRLLKDDLPEVRAAAATASGKLGRGVQDRLVKLIRVEAYSVQIGAAEGLAVSAEAGGSVEAAVDGIALLWKEQGRMRREAARIYARLARRKPAEVMPYLVAAARSPDDAGLHPLGVEGLCGAALAGSAEARRNLARATDDPSADVRRLVMQCVADGPDPAKNGAAIAARLVRDPDGEIRADAARVLAMTAAKGAKVAGGVGDALVERLDDPDREVRLVALRALAGLGADAPPAAVPAMAARFERADEGEKLAIVRAARQFAAADLVALASTDASPLVRVEAIDAALGAGLRASATLSAALADNDPQVRRAALERLAAQKDKLDPAVVDRALSLSVRDPDPDLSQLALTTVARVAAKDAVATRLHRALASRAERDRAQAAAAAIGLVDRDATLSVNLLEPLLDDPSRDVRAALLPGLAAAYAKTNEPAKLAALLRGSEAHAMRRLVVAAAFVTLARTDAGRAASEVALARIAADGPPMARFTARLVSGLLAGRADGITFLQELVP